jgi:hypothetical protein
LREQKPIIGISTDKAEELEKSGDSYEKGSIANWFGGRLCDPNGSRFSAGTE